MMWIALGAALIATAGNNIGKALQKRGVDQLPAMAWRLDVLKAYVANRVWLLGFGLDLAGAILTAVALALASVSVIQPILAAGMAFLAIFSHYYLHEHISHRDWFGVGLAVLGAIGMSTTLIKGEDRLLLPQAYVVLAVVLVLLALCEVLYRKQLWLELTAGLQAGICFGFSAAFLRGAMLLAQAHGLWWLGALGIAGAAVLSTAGFFFQTRGLQVGRAMVLGTYTTVFSLIVAVLVGLIALNEAMPPTNAGIAIRLGSMLTIIVGVALLAKGGAAE